MPPLQPRPGHFGLILPLCTSSATLGLALMQYPIFNSFLVQPPDSKQTSIAGRPLSTYWSTFLAPGTAVVALASGTSTLAGLLSARWLRSHATLETTDVGKWYTFGAALAALHFAFVPAVSPVIGRIVGNGKDERVLGEEEVEERNRGEMKTWFLWHTARTVLVDLPALWCFAEGAALSFWVI